MDPQMEMSLFENQKLLHGLAHKLERGRDGKWLRKPLQRVWYTWDIPARSRAIERFCGTWQPPQIEKLCRLLQIESETPFETHLPQANEESINETPFQTLILQASQESTNETTFQAFLPQANQGSTNEMPCETPLLQANEESNETPFQTLSPEATQDSTHEMPLQTLLPQTNQNSTLLESSEIVTPLETQDSVQGSGNYASRRLCTKTNLERTLALINIFSEALSAAFDQESSPNKPKYALIALVISAITMALCIGEFVYRAVEAKVVLRRWGLMYWRSHPPHDYQPFGTFSNIFGLISAVFQCIFSIIQYVYFSHHANNPLKISVLPLIFALCVAYSRFYPQDREPLPHRQYP